MYIPHPREPDADELLTTDSSFLFQAWFKIIQTRELQIYFLLSSIAHQFYEYIYLPCKVS